MGMLIRNLDRLRLETGAHIQVIHHGVKNKERSGGPRGHGSLIGAADAIVEVTKPESGYRTATITDAKDDPSGRTMSFDLDVVDLGEDDDGDPVTTCIVVEQESTASSTKVERLTPMQAGWWHDLQDMFAVPGLAKLCQPLPGMGSVLTLTREQVRQGFRSKGRFSVDADQPLTRADITKLSSILNSLKDKGKIGMTEAVVWQVRDGQG